jgi:hypothetical protein
VSTLPGSLGTSTAEHKPAGPFVVPFTLSYRYPERKYSCAHGFLLHGVRRIEAWTIGAYLCLPFYSYSYWIDIYCFFSFFFWYWGLNSRLHACLLGRCSTTWVTLPVTQVTGLCWVFSRQFLWNYLSGLIWNCDLCLLSSWDYMHDHQDPALLDDLCFLIALY